LAVVHITRLGDAMTIGLPSSANTTDLPNSHPAKQRKGKSFCFQPQMSPEPE
jgi:hypothetical protein